MAGEPCAPAYLQSQRITRPSAVAGVVAACLHVPANLLFIYGLGLGFVGAGIATSWSNGGAEGSSHQLTCTCVHVIAPLHHLETAYPTLSASCRCCTTCIAH
jgi:hypothetical protein